MGGRLGRVIKNWGRRFANPHICVCVYVRGGGGDLEHQLLESLCDGDVRLSAGFHEQAPMRLAEILTLFRGDFSIRLLRDDAQI